MGEAVSAATFGLPEDSVRVRLEVALIPPQARPPVVMCKILKNRTWQFPCITCCRLCDRCEALFAVLVSP